MSETPGGRPWTAWRRISWVAVTERKAPRAPGQGEVGRHEGAGETVAAGAFPLGVAALVFEPGDEP